MRRVLGSLGVGLLAAGYLAGLVATGDAIFGLGLGVPGVPRGMLARTGVYGAPPVSFRMLATPAPTPAATPTPALASGVAKVVGAVTAAAGAAGGAAGGVVGAVPTPVATTCPQLPTGALQACPHAKVGTRPGH